ncbi:hypothetical protein P152DRAFT_139147 [Eremomyces bilateralis CBS 781.70]|uniref:Uncharacterized protein n=1 Tax=Eremomyces bilateralis CBS 781.70 TaxID=1392243 RepID=A0A6G1FWG9_9PEZI|nr:uncharacterized protein P152DRAFT_139147 [Eremomyces bilateralis CBS 781.70]KAF1810078.1 hypothetical protein P152DRAFT_139147 [Eremomyces bilateralis CBS 781.70]
MKPVHFSRSTARGSALEMARGDIVELNMKVMRILTSDTTISESSQQEPFTLGDFQTIVRRPLAGAIHVSMMLVLHFRLDEVIKLVERVCW